MGPSIYPSHGTSKDLSALAPSSSPCFAESPKATWWKDPEHLCTRLRLCDSIVTTETSTVVQLPVKKVAPEASCRCQGHWASTARLGSHRTQVQLPLSLLAPIPTMEQTGSAPGSCGCRLWLWSCLAPLGPARKAGWARQCETKVRFPRRRGCQVTLESQHRPPQVAPGRRQDGLAVLQPEGQSTWEAPIAARVAAERTQVPGDTRHSELWNPRGSRQPTLPP